MLRLAKRILTPSYFFFCIFAQICFSVLQGQPGNAGPRGAVGVEGSQVKQLSVNLSNFCEIVSCRQAVGNP